MRDCTPSAREVSQLRSREEENSAVGAEPAGTSAKWRTPPSDEGTGAMGAGNEDRLSHCPCLQGDLG